MGKNNVELLKLAQKYLGKGGSIFNQFCHSSGAWCCAYVTYLFHKGDDAKLFYGGKVVVYCPTAIKWCSANLAMIPPYLALPMDIVFFDWNHNGLPDHIGFIRERKNCDEVYTIEGNTNGGVVAQKTRTVGYIQGIYRPHFPAKFDISKPLEIDGLFGYNSIAMMQKALGGLDVDGIMGKATVKKLQAWAGVAQDGAWGTKTSKAIQKKLGVTADGLFGKQSVMALQRWCNSQCKPTPAPTPTPKPTPTPTTKTQGDKIADSAKSYVGKVKYVKGGTSLTKGCDCTGFVQAIHKLHGITLDVRKSWGKSVGKDVSKAKRGDVIFYYMNGKLHHMGIYVGNNRVVHNSTSHKDWHKDCIESSVKMSGMKIGDIRRCWK